MNHPGMRSIIWTTTLRSVIALVIATVIAASAHLQATAGDAPMPGLAVHEWGTFTAVFSDDGRQLGSVNIDDEPVPHFVHTISPSGGVAHVPNPKLPGYTPGAVTPNPAATVRLETPVLYVHLPAGRSDPLPMRISATWHGGWLTQFYPQARFDGTVSTGTLSPSATSSLHWDVVARNEVRPIGPATFDAIWLAPREVQAAALHLAQGAEEERYLFYRGIGGGTSPWRARREAGQIALDWRSSVDIGAIAQEPSAIVISVQADGSRAWRAFRNGTASAEFTPAEHAATTPELEAWLHRALMADGLHADEATGMVHAWRVSWLFRPGLRVLAMVPQAHTDAELPLAITPAPSEVKRAMVARLELLADSQRPALARARQSATAAQDAHARHTLGRFTQVWLSDPAVR